MEEGTIPSKALHPQGMLPLADSQKPVEGPHARVLGLLMAFFMTVLMLFRSVTCRVTKKLQDASTVENQAVQDFTFDASPKEEFGHAYSSLYRISTALCCSQETGKNFLLTLTLKKLPSSRKRRSFASKMKMLQDVDLGFSTVVSKMRYIFVMCVDNTPSHCAVDLC
ncbi:hypothetical protein HAX54_035216 [Datura stramonium]|uniref:Uncharacterized protein n=1 Tax=Datura stramonium TaxID=4076 RepID=A0ABS8SF15_DATST|nr:hypothetical protein [Datura stramonium]